MEVERASFKTDKLEIRNHFAAVGEDRVFKWTEIQLDDRIIKIMDSFTSVAQPIYTNSHVIESRVPEPVKPVKERKNILDKRFKVFASDG